jgi:hypothetical protein
MPVIICGRCKERHSTVTQVRACHSSVLPIDPFDAPFDSSIGGARAIGTRPGLTVDPTRVPASNYALENKRGDVEFYRVDVPSKGKWEGFRFVERLYGAPGAWREVKVRGVDGVAVLARILDDTYTDETRGELHGPVAAALRFSRTFTRCAACSSPLSDPASIAEGLGPVCAARF